MKATGMLSAAVLVVPLLGTLVMISSVTREIQTVREQTSGVQLRIDAMNRDLSSTSTIKSRIDSASGGVADHAMVILTMAAGWDLAEMLETSMHGSGLTGINARELSRTSVASDIEEVMLEITLEENHARTLETIAAIEGSTLLLRIHELDIERSGSRLRTRCVVRVLSGPATIDPTTAPYKPIPQPRPHSAPRRELGIPGWVGVDPNWRNPFARPAR